MEFCLGQAQITERKRREHASAQVEEQKSLGINARSYCLKIHIIIPWLMPYYDILTRRGSRHRGVMKLIKAITKSYKAACRNYN